MTGTPVRHNAGASRFEAEVDGELSIAEYRLDGDVMSLTHTVVPEAQEGHGIASALAQAAFAHAQAEGLKVRPLCAFMAAYVQRHPELKAQLA
ncbi:GNAT family N-acetyltransferase [Aquabacterium sp. J223]|uniref:GNAT family N-acetyltransferase n=1 Tax=Aquabacterium sp. J223 TaxID=2898431 RepID=UPI0021AE001B|nr:GNAT family N-acetyltransferase [Aquabacterium sp. J223]UUX94107.1 N-acetyltransferase [Aquabacterium sp. J223]